MGKLVGNTYYLKPGEHRSNAPYHLRRHLRVIGPEVTFSPYHVKQPGDDENGGGGPTEAQVKGLSTSQGISEGEAKNILLKYQQQPGAPELAPVREAIKQTHRTTLKQPEGTIKVGTKTGKTEYVLREDYEKVQKELGSYAASVLKEKGIEAFNQSQEQYIEGIQAKAIDSLKKAEAEQERERTAAQEKVREQVSKYSDWTAQELMQGKVRNGKLETAPWGVKGQLYVPYPRELEQKIYDAKKEAARDLKPFLVKGITQKEVLSMIRKGKPKAEIVKAAAQIDREVYDIPAAMRAGKDAKLKLMGVPHDKLKDVKMGLIMDQVAEELKSNPDLKREEIEGTINSMVYNRAGWGEADQRALALATEIGVLALGVIIPGVYTAAYWNKLSPAMRGLSLAADAIVIAKLPRAALGAARAITTEGKILRLKAAARAMGGEALIQAEAPLAMLRHPLQTAKSFGREMRHMAEYALSTRKLSEAVVTTSTGVVALKISNATSPQEAMKIRDTMVKLAQQGEEIIVKAGGREYKLSRSALMKELGGGLTHATPDVRAYEKGTTIAEKAGMPLKEQGWFISPEPAPRFARRSAFGKEAIPLPQGAGGKVQEIAEYRLDHLVRLDKAPVRALNFGDAVNVPPSLAAPLQQWAVKTKAVLYGSFNEWLKIKKAAKPNDLDLVVRDSKKAIEEIIELAQREGIQARRVPHGVEIKVQDKWEKLADIVSYKEHYKMLPLPMVSNTIERLQVESLGKQFIGQAYGAVDKSAKAETRAAKLEKAAADVKKMLEQSGVGKMKPGVYITSPETAARSVPSGKLYHAAAEMERKLVIGETVRAPKQRLYFRTGPDLMKVELLLEKPLSSKSLLKLKALGFIEEAKTLLREPIQIRGIGPSGSLGTEEIRQLSNAIRTGRNIPAARALSANIGTISSLSRATALAGSEGARAPAPGDIDYSTGRIETERKTIAPAEKEPELKREPEPEKELERGPGRVSRRDAKVQRTRPERLESIRREIARLDREAAQFRQEARKQERANPQAARLLRLEAVKSSVRAEVLRKQARGKQTGRAPAAARTILGLSRTTPATTKTTGEPVRTTFITGKGGWDRGRITAEEKDSEKKKKGSIGKPIEKWTRKEIDSAIAWKQGAVVHAVKAPYRSQADVTSFHISKLPDNLQILKPFTGQGSAAASARTLTGKPPSIDIDMGKTDVIVRPGKQNRVRLSFRPDQQQRTKGDLSVTKTRNISKKKGPFYKTNVGGSTVLSRSPMKGVL